MTLYYNEKEINISDDTSLEIILDLFGKNKNDFDSLIKSNIFLNYASLINSVKICNFNGILFGISSVHFMLRNIKNIENIPLCVEKIMILLIDELNIQKKSKKKDD